MSRTKVCDNCGRTYTKAEVCPQQSLKHWAQRRFCGEDCRRVAHSQRMREQRGPAHPSWIGDAAKPHTGRMRAHAIYAVTEPCEVCGVERVDRHHKDGNTLNNDRSNIAFLCRKHHIEAEQRVMGWQARRERQKAAA